MAVPKRINTKQNLIEIPTFITEEGLSETKYFNVVGLKEELPTGKSSFLVGGSTFLKPNIRLKLEILDSAGNVIYTEPVRGYRENNLRRISIEIYKDANPGIATLTLLGELDSTKMDIPQQWRGVYNAKYIRRFNINTRILNTEPIIFYDQPTVSVFPLTNAFKEYTKQPRHTRILTGQIKNKATAEATVKKTIDPVTKEETFPTETEKNKSKPFLPFFNLPSFKLAPLFNFKFPLFSFSPPQGDAILHISSGSIDDGMIGESLTFTPASANLDTSANQSLPDSYVIPPAYSSSIVDRLTDTRLDIADVVYVSSSDAATKYPINTKEDVEFSVSYRPLPTESDSVINYFDVADVRLSNMRTISGDVKYVNIYALSKGAQSEQGFDLITQTPLEAEELIFDSRNIKNGRTGFFLNQNKVNSYWNAFASKGTQASGSGTPANNIKLEQTGSKIAYAMSISGSVEGKDEDIVVETSQSFDIVKSTPYSLSFKAYSQKLPKDSMVGNRGILECYVSGSKIPKNHNLGNGLGRRILTIDLDSKDYEALNPIKPNDDGIYETNFNNKILDGTFVPLQNDNVKLQFRVNAGFWHLSDISLRPAAETNFNPRNARVFSEMPPSRNRPDEVRFLLEFVNNDGVKADTTVLSDEVTFPGANFAIQGDNNVLSGSMYISNAIGEGIEMAGLNSAFLRTIGWEGFNSASNAGKGGFIIYSGSVLPDSPDNYKGAGLEIHDGNSGSAERYFQFRTNDGNDNAIFKVKTDDYLFGISGSGGVESYISGADGKIEISSSNFHLSNDGSINAGVGNLTLDTSGNVAMAGTVTATAGNIGNWKIASGLITGSNITLDADGSRIYKTDSNGELDGYYIDFTPGSNYYVRFGNDFAVSSSGTLIASGAKIEGVVTASGGFIGNWTIGTDSLHKQQGSTFTGISSMADPAAAGTPKATRFFAGATSLPASGSAPFNVKSDGTITASKGEIGGWNLSSDRISSPVNAQGTSSLTLESDNGRIIIRDKPNNKDVMRIGDISDGAAGNKFGLVQFDGTGIDFETDRILSLGDRGNLIGGWEITTGQIRGVPDAGVGQLYADGETKLIIHSEGRIETSDFATGLKGWRIDSLGNGTAEFENCRIRGTLRTTVFEKESVNVVGGQLMVANSTTMQPLMDESGSILAGAASMSATDTTMSVANASGFAAGEIIKAKKVDDTGFIVEYMMITGSMRYTEAGSPYSASIASANMGANDPDGLAGELYIGRGYGQTNVVSSSIGTLDTSISDTATYGTQINMILDLASNSVTTQSILKINDERFKVISASGGTGTTGNNQTIKVVRDYLSTDTEAHSAGVTVYSVDTDAEFLFGLVSSAQTYNEGQVIVSTGKYDASKDLSTGYIMMNANPNDPGTPYMDIVERTGSGVYDLQLRARLGDLSGLSSGYLYGDEEPGFGLYTDNGYFRGSIQALTGSIHGILNIATTAGGIESGDKMMLGRNVAGSNDGMYINSNNYWYTNGAWKVGGGTNYLSLDSAAGGNITIASQTFDLDATTLIMDSAGDGGTGTIRLGGSGGPDSPTSNTAGIYMDGGGAFNAVGTTNDLIRFDGGSLTLKSTTFNLTANTNDLIIDSVGHYISLADGNITLDGTSTGFFEIGGLSSTSANQTAKGVYFEGDGDFIIKSNTTANENYIQGVGGDLIIKADDLEFTATTFNLTANTNDLIIDSAGHSISLADGNITLDGTDDGFFEIGTLTDTSTVTGTLRGFRVDGLGNMLLKAADASTNYIKFDVDGGGSALEIKTDNFEVVGGDVTMAGTVSASAGNIGGFNISPVAISSTDKSLVLSGSGAITASDALIAGWTVDSNAIYYGTEGSNASFTATNSSITLGAGFISAKNFYLDSSGNARIDGTISASVGDIGGWKLETGRISSVGKGIDKGFLTYMSASQGIGFQSESADYGYTSFVELNSSASYKPGFTYDGMFGSNRTDGAYNAGGYQEIYPQNSTDQEATVYHRHYFESEGQFYVNQIAGYEQDVSGSVYFLGSTSAHDGTVAWTKEKPTSHLFRIPDPWKQFQNVGMSCDFKTRLDFVDNTDSAATAIVAGEVSLDVDVYDGEDNWVGNTSTTQNMSYGSAAAERTVSFDSLWPQFSLEDDKVDREFYLKVTISPKFSYFGYSTNNVGVRVYPVADSIGKIYAYQNKTFLNNAGLQVFGTAYQEVRLGGKPHVRGDFQVRKSAFSDTEGGSLFVEKNLGVNHTPTGMFNITVGKDFQASGSAGSIGASGDIVTNRNVIGYALYNISDRRLKDNIVPITSSLDTIRKVQGVEFDWKNKTDNKHDIGFIAQDIEAIPQLHPLINTQEFVDEPDKEYKVVAYEKLVPYLVESIKEQQGQINDLKEQVNSIVCGSLESH